ncbi:dihydrodipicolinate synthase family protein [Candidatus Solirubrobacter pratensis]|uniref:dihydrodipicolinate synthase family protein n=1 Tax=Candidatus Solirubrobacter pratensis TaxID=1298857 RepID=UPI0004095F5F|nr:dihydrodipicolinate synthase family protein [Candidatus Solirubrobacter pratensis]
MITLPRADGSLEAYEPAAREPLPALGAEPRTRVAFAAAHVVADPLAGGDPTGPARLDWEATLAFRRHLWSHGLRVAEAMDTAQRGMGLDWVATQELIRRSVAEAHAVGGKLACGAGTDQLERAGASVDDVRRAYQEQLAFIEGEGAPAILMASRALVRAARSADDYREVYGELIAGAREPVILHWLGDMFDPQLAGYWGTEDLDEAAEVVLSIIEANPSQVDGIKVSLLDAGREVALRERLPEGVRMYTGDDFDYPELIGGGSDALLGIFDAIAPAAAAALHALDEGDLARYDELLAPTVPLSRHIFSAPTPYYKTGVVFLAFLNGHQSHFRMVGGLESGRSVLHLAELFVLADRAGLLRDPELASERMRHVLALAGVT